MLGKAGGYAASQDLRSQGLFPASDPDDHWWLPSGRIFYSPPGQSATVQELDFARKHFFLPHRFQDPFGQVTQVSHDGYPLLIQETQDPAGNRVTSGERALADGSLALNGNDYRVLGPALVMDANRKAIAFDALGMPSGTAVMGKPEDAPQAGDSLVGFAADMPDAVILAHLADPLANPAAILETATSRLVYDLFAYQRSQTSGADPQPAVVYTIARETHVSDLAAGQQTRFQHSLEYSDGFGRVIQKVAQAEPGPLSEGSTPVNPRWVASGWTIFNNKGQPARLYEPFFKPSPAFVYGHKEGVSQTLFYDPPGRKVVTLHPDNTYEKVVFDPWQQASWDVNDTATQSDPKLDPDVGAYFQRLPDEDYLPTWYDQRQAAGADPQEKAAADAAAVHAGTPSLAYFDALGRPFLTIAHNRWTLDGATTEERYRTRLRLDISGNQRAVEDALDRTAMRSDYDVPGKPIHQDSLDAGERWMLNDVTGKPVFAWDSRGQDFRTEYDPLRRPLHSFVKGADPNSPGTEILYQKIDYGEGQANDFQLNLRGRVFRQYDQAGQLTNLGQNPVTGQPDAYDFKGNLLCSERQFTAHYQALIDWSGTVDLDQEVYTRHTRFDALNRPVALTAPDASVIRPAYNEANLLESLAGDLPGTGAQAFVTNIDYNAKGQRILVEYGNGASCSYTYDPQTFRLINLVATRSPAAFPTDCPTPPPSGWPGCGLQDLRYTYDPVGNITHIADEAQQTIYFKNQRVEPSADYIYDAAYRLLRGIGREHLGQTGGQRNPPRQGDHDDSFHMGQPLATPNDGLAMGRYAETYAYDPVGNFLQMIHHGTDPANPGWTRLYNYELGNHLGSAVIELDETAQLISYEEYYPYGGTSYQAVRSQTETPKRYRYTGKERDEESGLYYHGARYYAPWLGRWTSPDPAGMVDGTNLYRFSVDSPARFQDQSGLYPTEDAEPEPPKISSNFLNGLETDKQSTSNFINEIEHIQFKQIFQGSQPANVSQKDVTENDVSFGSRRVRDLIQQASKEFDVNPGLLAEHLVAEPEFLPGESLGQYLRQTEVGSADLGLDDFVKERSAINKLVPKARSIADIPASDFNPESNARQGINRPKHQVSFTPENAVRAAAAYIKYKEEIAKANLGDKLFDSLPPEVKLQLNRLLVNPGVPNRRNSNIGTKYYIDQIKKGNYRNIFDFSPRSTKETTSDDVLRRATIHTARAIHLSIRFFSVVP